MSPTRVFMANGRKALVLVSCAAALLLYLSFLIFNYKDEIRLLEESSASLKQNQDKLAAQLQVAQEHKSRLQNQVDLGIKSLRTLKDEFVTFREKKKSEQEKMKGDSEKKYDALKQSYDLTKSELEDITHEHQKLTEANKLTMEECEKDAEEKNKQFWRVLQTAKVKALQQLQDLRDKDQLAATNEATRSKTKVDTLSTNVAALQAVNAELKASLSFTKAELNRARAELLSKENRLSKNINSEANDAFIHSPVNDSKTDKKSGDVITKKLDAAVNTGGHHSHNLVVPSIQNDNNKNNHVLPAQPPVDHKNIQNPQIAKPVGAESNGADALANSPGMMRMRQNPVIPKDQDSIQIAHPWAKRISHGSHDSHDSGFKVVGQPVLAQPRFHDGGGGSKKTKKNIPLDHENLGVLAQPRLDGGGGGGGGERKKADVIPFGDRDRQVAAPNLVQVHNPLEAEGNPGNSNNQPQLQVNAPEGDVQKGGNGKPGGENDDDEDHAFGNDKDYGAGALDKPDRGNHGGAVDAAAVVGAAPPEFDDQKFDDQKIGNIQHDFNQDFKRKKKFA